MICEICGANPAHDSTKILYRINEKGVKGIWRCQEHLEGYLVDANLQVLTDIIAGKE